MADVISRLRLESGEFDSKIKRAGQELLAYSSHCRKMGLEMGYANKDAQDFARQLGSMATVSQTARGKISELSEAFVNAKVMYKNMTDEEKNNQFGKNLAASLDQLKIRIEAAKQDFADVNKELAGGGKFGEFGNIIDTIGSKLGVTGNLTEMLTSKTAMLTGAVGAGIAIVSKATEAWAGYNSELAKQDQITTVTTGLKGEDANRMTDTMRALSDTYNVDFREAINAANTLMTQFGKTGDEATQLIKDGMQGMIQGDGPKLLSMIQQYAPAFRDAGVSASQLVAVIQNSEGGIFTDQNMNAIVMGIKNIRLMTDATSQALAKMGIDGKKMSEQLSNGTLTIFDALKQVSHQLQTVDSNSKTAGEVMQQVFGRQGVTAGTNLAKAIETLNTILDETKRQTGEVGQSLADLQTANEKLNKAIRDCFEYDGWDQMANGIKANLVTALATVLDYIGKIKGSLSDFATSKGLKSSGGYDDIEEVQQWINNGKDDAERRARYDKAIADLQKKLNNIGKERQVRNSDGSTSFVIDDAATQAKKRDALQKRMGMLYATSYTPEPPKGGKGGKGGVGSGKTITTTGIKDEFTEMEELLGLIPVAEQKVKDLQQQIRESWDEGEIEKLREDLKLAQAELDRLNGKAQKIDLSKMFPERSVTSQPISAGEQMVQSIRLDMAQSIQNADMQTLRTLMEAQIKNGIEGVDIPADWITDQIFGEGVDIPDEYWQYLQEQINEKLREMEIDPVNIDFSTGKAEKKKDKEEKEDKKYLSDGISKLAGGLGGIQSGFQQFGIDLGDGFSSVVGGLQGISSILMAIQTIVAAIEIISSADAIIPFAHGGIVRAAGGTLVGNTYSGDQLRGIDQSGQIYGLNAGEVVLNRSQVGNLASQLEGVGLGNLNLTATIRGEQIRLALNNNGRRTGKGEYVQSNK